MMTKNLIIKTAQPFFFPGNEVGCVLVHGFTGSPKEMRWIGEFLAKKGFSVIGVRLAGHATQPEDLIRTRWWDWLASVEDGINLLHSHCKQIFTIGLSMGGLLALLSASRYPINGVIGMSTPFSLPDDWRLKFAKPISIFKPYIEKGPDDMKNRQAAKTHIDYPAYPIRSIVELNNLIEEMRSELSEIKIPVLLIHSEQDKSIPFESMQNIFQILKTKDKQMVVLKKSSHVITEDIEREIVFNKAFEFINNRISIA